MHGVLFAAVLVGSVVTTAHASGPCGDPTERFVRVGQTVTMCIPQSWIDSVVRSETDGALLLFALWPSLGGFHDGQEETRPYNFLERGGLVQVLLHLSDRINPLQERYENTVRMYSPHSRHEPTMGLEHWGRDEAPTWNPDTESEVYFTINSDGHVDRYITCRLPNVVPAPACAEETYIGPFLAEITYSRVFLQDWHGIETGIARKILLFIR